MILSTEEIVQKYPNGNYKYIETISIISPMWIANYPNKRIAPDGAYWIRTGVNKKFRPNGEVEWELKYNDFGDLVS